METAESRQRQNRAGELQRLIVQVDSDIRRSREKLNALKRAHGPATQKKPNKPLPTEVCEMLCQLRDALKTHMKESSVLRRDKAGIEERIKQVAAEEITKVKAVAEVKQKYIPTASFMKYDPTVVASQRYEHTKKELASVHTVIDAQMQVMTKAFDTAARKCELDKRLIFLQNEVTKKKAILELIDDECSSMSRVYDRKKLSLARAPKPLDPMEVLQLDMQKEVAYDALTKQEHAAVSAKESIAYRANLLCQLERQLKVTADGIQHCIDSFAALAANAEQEQRTPSRSQPNEENNNNNNAAASAATGTGEEGSPNAEQQQQQQQGGGEGENRGPSNATSASSSSAAPGNTNAPVRATFLAQLRKEVAQLNSQDKKFDEELKQLDSEISDLEYRAKVMTTATDSLENERQRLLRQHNKHISQLQHSMEEQTSHARELLIRAEEQEAEIEERRSVSKSRSVSAATH